jgi:hypothetical protein
MIFNHGIHRKIAGTWKAFHDTHRLLLLRRDLYPARNFHIAEQIVASLVLGKHSRLRFAELDPRHVPSYVEWKGNAASRGIVMHLWNLYAPFYVLEESGASALRRMRFPFRIEAGRSPV